MRYDTHCKNCGLAEIEKAMDAPLPRCSGCRGTLKRVFSNPAVVFNVGGFYSTDYRHMEKQIGNEKAARLRAQRDDAEKRAKSGQLTGYEKALEAVD